MQRTYIDFKTIFFPIVPKENYYYKYSITLLSIEIN